MSRYILCDDCQIYDTLEDCVVQDFEVLLNQQDEKIKELEMLNEFGKKEIHDRNKRIDDIVEKDKKIIEELEKDYSSYKKISDTNREYYISKLDYAFKQNNRLKEENDKLKQELANELDDHEKFVLIANDELQKLKTQNIELCAKLNMKEHKPAFCKLADKDCEYFGKVEELEKQLKQKFEDMPMTDFIRMAKKNGYKVKANEDNSNQLAIEELKKIKKLQHKTLIYDEEENSLFSINIDDYIDKKINELRGEK